MTLFSRDSRNIMLDPQIAQHFRDQFRAARASCFQDAEGFQEILFVVERLGFILTNEPDALTLARYKPEVQKLSAISGLAAEIPKRWRHLHTPMCELYDIVRIARNDALHQGAFARHLTTHAVELALILEDALMDGSNKVSGEATDADQLILLRPFAAARRWSTKMVSDF